MMRSGFVAAGVMAASIAVSAQQPPQPAAVPLGDVARQAEAAKATVKKAKKTYTNADLSTDLRGEPAPAPATAAGPPAKSAEKAATPDQKPAATSANADAEKPKESEQAWRSRADSLRKQMDEVQQRITALTANTPTEAAVRQANDAQVNIARQALEGLRKKWRQLEAGAVERKVPSAWLDPRPPLQ